MKWLNRLRARLWRPEPNLQLFFESLAPCQVGRDGYTQLDRYRDFGQTFGSPVGRKVLHQIIDHCEGKPVLEGDAEETHRTAFRNGRRSVGLWVIKTMNAIPLDRAEQAETVDPNEVTG